jgi:predicted permease
LPGRRYTYYWVSIFARLAPGVSQAAATARIAAISPALLEQSVPLRYDAGQRRSYLANHLVVSSARTGVDWMLRNRFGPPLYSLLGTCAAVLLIASLNLAGLLAARMLAREKEIRIRVAIGGAPWRVLRPLALESLMLTIGGGIAGMLLASWARQGIAAAASAMFSGLTIDVSPGRLSLVVFAAMLLCAAVTLTAIPLWHARRSGSVGNYRGVIGGSARAQKSIMSLQVAFTLALVTASGAFAASFSHLANLPLGFAADGLSEAMLSPLPGGYRNSDSDAYYAALLDRIGSVGGVESAALSSFALFWHGVDPDLIRTAESGRELRAETIRVSDSYFRTIGVRPLAGENFRRERRAAEAIVSESVARLLGETVVGKEILIGETGSARRYRVIGTVPTMRISMVEARDPASLVVYLSFWEDARAQRYPVLLVKGARGAVPDAVTVDRAVETLGREYVESYRSVRSKHDESILEDRLLAYLAGVFTALALVLAAIGLFAILSAYVARRTSEIGIRIALGAHGVQIATLVFGQIGPVMVIGLGAGILLSLPIGDVLARAGYGGMSRNAGLLAGAVVCLCVTACLAASIPARRAATIQPLDALREN